MVLLRERAEICRDGVMRTEFGTKGDWIWGDWDSGEVVWK
jgi:hypothetical protein